MIADLLRRSIQLVPWQYRRHIKDLSLVGPAQRWVVSRFLVNQPFLHTVDAGPAEGLRIWIRLPEDKPIWTGTYEADFAMSLADAVREDAVCLDIGGYRGFFSAVFALAGASAVHIFEPLPENIRRIESLMEVNPSLPLELHRIAIGAVVGEAEFLVMPETSMGKLSESSFQEQQSSGVSLKVPIETLDHLIETGIMGEPDVIKIDVEGAEAMVLKGGERLLGRRGPLLFLEIHSRALARECHEIMTGHGYSVAVMETGESPDFASEPEICHFAGRAIR